MDYRNLTPAEAEAKSFNFVTGYSLAEKEFETEEKPAFLNPFIEGSDQHRGYEEAVYDFTQK